MSDPKAIIADDEEQLRTYLKTRLKEIWPELIICGEAKNGLEAIQLVEEHKPDISFLDIKMPGMTGIEIASTIAKSSWIVFITAFDQYAVEAFRQEAIDYILKPVTLERLEITVARLKNKIASSPSVPNGFQEIIEELMGGLKQTKHQDYLQWIKAQHRNDIQLIPTDDVCYFKASDKYTLVITRDGEYLIRTPIKELTTELDPKKFWQINRGIIINVSNITKVSRSLTGRFIVKLHDLEDMLTVSRTYTHLFKQM
jgi:DNA-binding LytR/AlgR family response regulator